MPSTYSDFSELREQSGIFVQCNGGLGNQLFQLALANELATQTNLPVSIEISHFDLHFGHEGFVIEPILDSMMTAQTKALRTTKLPKALMHLNRISPYAPKLFEQFSGLRLQREAQDFVFDQHVDFLAGKNLISGHWQSARYFDQTRATLLESLGRHLQCGQARRKLDVTLENTTGRELVMVHVRRGDYITNESVHGLLGRNYYESAISQIQNYLKNPLFLIFSDDPARVRSEGLFSEEVSYFVDDHMTSLQVLSFMSACNHFVVANSTFSWWGAAIGSYGKEDSIVIAPEKWSAAGAAPELLLPGWLPISTSN